MIRSATTVIALSMFAAPAFADSDLSEGAALGAAAFKLCQSCHVVVDDDGNTLAGKKAKTGPNLYGVIGQTAGTVEGYRYGKSIVAAGEAGLVWDEEAMVAYLQDPKKFLQTYLDDDSARSKMSYKARADKKNDLTAEQVAANFYAFLAEIGPEMEMEMEMDEESEDETENSN